MINFKLTTYVLPNEETTEKKIREYRGEERRIDRTLIFNQSR